MTILFTEGFGIYGPAGPVGVAGLAARLKEKWTSTPSTVTDAQLQLLDGYHTGTTDVALAMGFSETITQLLAPDGSTRNTVVVGFRFKGPLTYDGTVLKIRNGSGSDGICYVQIASTGAIKVIDDVTENERLTTATGIVVANTWCYLEFKITFGATGAANTCIIRKDGVQVAATTTASWNNGTLAPDRISLHAAGPASGAPSITFQDFYVLDTTGSAPHNDFLGEIRIETLFPSNAGSVALWSGDSAVVNENQVNMLTDEQASFEAGINGWAVSSNATIAQSTGGVTHGTKSLAITTVSGGDAIATTPTGTAGFPVVGGQAYSGRMSVTRTWETFSSSFSFRWYDAAGAFISDTFGNGMNVANVTTELIAENKIAPANAKYLAIISVHNNQAGHVHYIDSVMIVKGTTVGAFSLKPAFSKVRETPNDGDVSFVESDIIGNRETYAHTNLVTSQGQIVTVRPQIILSKTTTGSRTVGAVARPTTTEYDSSETVSPETAINTYRARQLQFSINPATGQPWTIAEVNAAEFGFKIVT